MRVSAIAVALGFLVLPAQADDRPPSAEQRTQIENALKSQGFTSWGKVERDDSGHWDVDNAIGPDGKRYDLDLGTSDYKVIKKELDND